MLYLIRQNQGDLDRSLDFAECKLRCWLAFSRERWALVWTEVIKTRPVYVRPFFKTIWEKNKGPHNDHNSPARAQVLLMHE